jgi:tetratricopeptide (TPR) repeat protein
VATLLEGSVRKSGKRLRITAQLINIKNGYHLWSERFDQKLDDIFEIQDEIAMQIVDKLKIRLNSEEESVLVKRYTKDLEAHNLYLKGRYYWNKITEKGITTGLDFFNQAIRKDPRYVMAYSGMADCYCRLGWYSYLSPEETFPNAKDAAYKALKIADHLAEAYASLAFVSMCYDRDYTQAEKEIKQAIHLNPGYAEAYFNYSVILSITCRHEESIAAAEKALELDPLTLMMYLNLAMRHYYAHQFDLALKYINKSLEMDPGFEIAHYYRGFAYLQKKMYKEALNDIRRVIRILGRSNPGFLGLLGIIQAFTSDRVKAENVIIELFEQAKQKYISPFWIAVLYFALDQIELFFEWLSKGYNEHDVLMIFLKVDPIFDPIRSDPRFQEMLKKMNLGS